MMTNRNACVLLDAAKVADLKAFAAALTKLAPWQLAMVAGGIAFATAEAEMEACKEKAAQ